MPMRFRFHRTVFLLIAMAFFYACNHPIEIVGDDDVVSSTGTRNCYLEDFLIGLGACTKNLVVGEFHETYYAVPRNGWLFSRWENYCTESSVSVCSLNVPADTVQENWGQTVPPLIAVFRRVETTKRVRQFSSIFCAFCFNRWALSGYIQSWFDHR
jgi:hypothetical protein